LAVGILHISAWRAPDHRPTRLLKCHVKSLPQLLERCFCRLKDWRRIATRYDKLARNFLSALCFVAMVAYWL
jgi:hypothetical protein